jgi:2-polyprenyl-6-hydroxyphenyl methylase/3-demethylubiquinone-9 3-methyltransferase
VRFSQDAPAVIRRALPLHPESFILAPASRIQHPAVINVDPAELEKFNQLAHRWWDPASEFRPLHEINPLRLGHIDRTVPLAGKSVLDVGCGGGILAESMAALGARVTGIDLGEQPLTVAQLHLLESGLNVEYRLVSAEALAREAPRSFDVVTCMELLEHVPDPGSTVAACATLLKPGGHAFFATINRNPKSYLFAVIGAEYVLRLLPRGTHDYARFIKPSELAGICRRYGLSVGAITGMTYNPITRVYSLGANIDVNYILHARLESGD